MARGASSGRLRPVRGRVHRDRQPRVINAGRPSYRTSAATTTGIGRAPPAERVASGVYRAHAGGGSPVVSLEPPVPLPPGSWLGSSPTGGVVLVKKPRTLCP